METVYKHLRNVSKKFRNIFNPEQEISLHLSNFSKEVSQLTDWQTYKKFRIIWNKCTNIQGMPPKIFRKISHPELKISLNLSNFSKEVSQLTYWQTYKKFRIIWNKCTNIPGMSPKKSERYLIQNWRYPYNCVISVRKWAK